MARTCDGAANPYEGITFRSDGNVKPVCFYDSGFYQDLIGHKPQYGYVIYWAGGPLIWRSKKHTNIPLHTSEAEYMTITHAFTVPINQSLLSILQYTIMSCHVMPGLSRSPGG